MVPLLQMAVSLLCPSRSSLGAGGRRDTRRGHAVAHGPWLLGHGTRSAQEGAQSPAQEGHETMLSLLRCPLPEGITLQDLWFLPPLNGWTLAPQNTHTAGPPTFRCPCGHHGDNKPQTRHTAAGTWHTVDSGLGIFHPGRVGGAVRSW